MSTDESVLSLQPEVEHKSAVNGFAEPAGLSEQIERASKSQNRTWRSLKMLVGLVTILKIILSVTEDLKRIF
ncbi:Uncharacterised protein [Vibrio cholerae]|uniref:Uncharacterized protein n=1 Tax=Vibrio cholerae TaxID=666 RepID=A0A655PSH7_VIBCL|nr:Uncharacterised protein [Vibrio cholerae]CSB14686.1 Uncharacterised protein [Vibrio cholerae]CSI71561.1 Uncharacterised protein [Vibrio cholerae]